jgi:uncharacterized protein with PIN domain
MTLMVDRLENPMERPRAISRPAFVAESTLGRLAKWLRLAGFDTLYDTQPPHWRRLRACADAENRVVLSRTRRVIGRLRADQGLLIQFDTPIEQVRQVIKHYHIRPGDLDPLSRCSRCNSRLRPADEAHLQKAVPDYVRQHHVRFMMCAQCGRIYWPGSHCSRMAGLFQRWFGRD